MDNYTFSFFLHGLVLYPRLSQKRGLVNFPRQSLNLVHYGCNPHGTPRYHQDIFQLRDVPNIHRKDALLREV